MLLPYHIATHTQSGNALFLILIAVALFAALSYAVTQSGRGSGSVTKEQAHLTAAQLLNTGAAMKTATDRMIMRGIPVNTMVMSTSACGAGAFCTSGDNCLFAPEGGGVTVPSLPFVQDYCFNAQAMGDVWFGVEGLGQDFSGTPPTATGYDTNIEFVKPGRDVCQAVNNIMGVAGIPMDTNNSDHILSVPGKVAFCIQFDAAPTDVSVFYVLNET